MHHAIKKVYLKSRPAHTALYVIEFILNMKFAFYLFHRSRVNRKTVPIIRIALLAPIAMEILF